MSAGIDEMEFSPEEYVERLQIENNTSVREEVIKDAFTLAYQMGYEMAIMSYGSDAVQLIPQKQNVEIFISQTSFSDTTLGIDRDDDGFTISMPHKPQINRSKVEQRRDSQMDSALIAHVNVFMENWWKATERNVETVLEHVVR